jgi:hypothetical protein
MSSLSLLNDTGGSLIKGTSGQMISCSPALATLLIGAIIVMYDIVIKRPGLAAYHLVVTIGVTIGVLLLCILGLTNVGVFVVLFPVIIFVAIVVIIMLALMIGSPEEPDVPIEPTHTGSSSDPGTSKPDDKLRSSYDYVMTGKGFGLF